MMRSAITIFASAVVAGVVSLAVSLVTFTQVTAPVHEAWLYEQAACRKVEKTIDVTPPAAVTAPPAKTRKAG